MLFHKSWVGVRYRGETNSTLTLVLGGGHGWERITAIIRNLKQNYSYSGHAVVVSMLSAL